MQKKKQKQEKLQEVSADQDVVRHRAQCPANFTIQVVVPEFALVGCISATPFTLHDQNTGVHQPSQSTSPQGFFTKGFILRDT